MNKKNVAIIAKCLSVGGAERAAATLSIILDSLGFTVFFILLENDITFKYRGKVHVLNKNKKTINFLNKIVFLNDFRKYIKKNSIDFIIDFRGRTIALREFLIYNFVYKNPEKVIFTIHGSKKEDYIPKPFFLFKTFFKNALKVVTVSIHIEEEIKKVYSLNNVLTINNVINFDEIDSLKNKIIEETGDFVLVVGRFTSLKQHSKLIEIYPESILLKKKIKLIFMGEGELKESLMSLVKDRKLEDCISFIPFQKNPYKYMSKAKFLILSSKREGFPYVLIESLACNVPVVSFNCKSGPSEIIEHNKNGLLVENQDFNKLRHGINKMITDNKLYDICKANTRSSVEKFSVDNISILWQNLLQ